jgi:hypothetical protein
MLVGSSAGIDQPAEAPVIQRAENSIVATTINGNATQYNYYRSTDPTDRRFSSELTLHVVETFQAMDGIKTGFGAALYDPKDPSFKIDGRIDGQFLIWAGDKEPIALLLGAKAPTCQSSNGRSVGGLYTTTEREGPRQLVHITALPADNPVLRAICYGLDRPSAANLSPGVEEGASNFDLLSNEEGSLATLMLLPGDSHGTSFEVGNTAWYWYSFDQAIDAGSPKNVLRLLGPVAMKKMMADVATKGRSDVSIELSSSDGASPSYSGASKDAYGPRLSRLTDLWEKFLLSSKIRLNGSIRQIAPGGKPAAVIDRLRLVDIRTDRFWQSLNQQTDYMREVACLAASFVVENAYSSPSDVPFYRSCAE